MKLNKLYKKTKKDQLQSWEIEVEGDHYRTHEGIKDGTITTSEWTYCKPSNIGRSNEKSAEQQAEFEARAKFQKKEDQGYVQCIEDIDQVHHFEPMLAFNYNDHKFSVQFPCFVQPKLDGIRCIAKEDGLWSRNGKKIVACPHIEAILYPIFEKYPGLIIDGELYNMELRDNFDKIVSCVRKTKLSEKEIEESKEFIQYHIYDIYIGSIASFEERNKIILYLFNNVPPSLLVKNNLSEDEINKFIDEWKKSNSLIFTSSEDDMKTVPVYKHLVVVPTYKVNSFEELDQYYEEFLGLGYEGQMIRKNAPYENKRTKSLLKRKEHIDEEFEILDICEGLGNRSEMAGYLICKLLDGRTFNSNIKGGFDFYKELWNNKSKYIGQKATIRFQNWTPDKMPRFPRCIAIRNYE